MATNSISGDIKSLSKSICEKHNVIIGYIETDKDHIHYMIKTELNINLSDFVRTRKSYTIYHIWKKYHNYLSKCFWKEHTFWTDGYFVCSVGNVSEKILKENIDSRITKINSNEPK